MGRRSNKIFKGIGNIFYFIMTLVIIFLLFQFALFTPFKGNVYWVFIMGGIAGGFTTYIFKKP